MENAYRSRKRPADRVIALLAVATLGFAGSFASAAMVSYAPPTINGNTVTFPVVNESSPSGDPLPLYGAPTVAPGTNVLSFRNLSGFSATSTNGSPALDFTDGQLNATIVAKQGQFITSISLAEFGDWSLARPLNPTGLASIIATSPGLLVTITAINGLGVTQDPILVPLGYDDVPAVPPTENPYVRNFLATEVARTGAFQADAFVSLAGLNVTSVSISLDNQLYAASQSGTSASVTKKGLDLSINTLPVPEPTVAGLIFLALPAMLRRRATVASNN